MTRHEEKGPDGGIGACWCSCDEHALIRAFCKGKPSCLECSSGTICGVWIRERAQRKEKSNQVHIDTFWNQGSTDCFIFVDFEFLKGGKDF